MMKINKIKVFITVAMILGILQIKSFAFAQTQSSKTGSYIIAFNPVYASGLIDLGYVAFEDLYLVVSDTSLKIDSVMSALSKKKYATMLGVLDTLKQQFKVYNVVENTSRSKLGNRENETLMDCNSYRSAYLFSLNEVIRQSSSLVGFVVRMYTSKERIKYKVLSDKCDIFPNECKAQIISL